MRDFYKILGKLTECPKKMVHYKSFPAGTLHLSVYCFDQEKTFLYDHPTMDQMEAAVKKDWGMELAKELYNPNLVTTIPALPPLPPLPSFK